uniref:Serine protease inhibitor Cvsi-2-like n=1 Tax=Crassostrea virginica TaxID=6565 RepID=A0A8B8CWQ9_CRAVI|nr:serine protease inhibitor Cvsi-2-like [Crassostrea virginica]
MRVIFVLAAVVVAVSSEMCRETRDCSLTTCSSGNEIHCINHQCTCTSSGSGTGSCVLAADCHGRCDHGTNHHCIDGRCRCTHF